MRIARMLFWISISLFVVGLAGAQDVGSSTIERLKRTVLPVVCVGQESNGRIYLISVEGTGVFVAEDGTFVTAGHVAKGMTGSRIPVCAIQAIYIPTQGWNSGVADFPLQVISIKECWWDDSIDVGVCTVKDNPFTLTANPKPLVAEFSGEIPTDGTPVAFTGFPLQFLQPITSQGTIGTSRAYVGDKSGARELIVDKNAWPGASGSPLYTASGKIVGLIVQRGFNDASGLAFARSSTYVTDFLSRNKAEREKAEQSQPR